MSGCIPQPQAPHARAGLAQGTLDRGSTAGGCGPTVSTYRQISMRIDHARFLVALDGGESGQLPRVDKVGLTGSIVVEGQGVDVYPLM